MLSCFASQRAESIQFQIPGGKNANRRMSAGLIAGIGALTGTTTDGPGRAASVATISAFPAAKSDEISGQADKLPRSKFLT